MYLIHNQTTQGVKPWVNKEKIMSVNYNSQFKIKEVITAKVLDRRDHIDYIPQIRHLVEVELENVDFEFNFSPKRLVLYEIIWVNSTSSVVSFCHY